MNDRYFQVKVGNAAHSKIIIHHAQQLKPRLGNIIHGHWTELKGLFVCINGSRPTWLDNTHSNVFCCIVCNAICMNYSLSPCKSNAERKPMARSVTWKYFLHAFGIKLNCFRSTTFSWRIVWNRFVLLFHQLVASPTQKFLKYTEGFFLSLPH